MRGKQVAIQTLTLLLYISCRYALRTLLIPFSLPQVGLKTEEIAHNFESLNQRLEQASCLAGLIVSLEATLEEEGYSTIMNELNKEVVSIMGPHGHDFLYVIPFCCILQQR